MRSFATLRMTEGATREMLRAKSRQGVFWSCFVVRLRLLCRLPCLQDQPARRQPRSSRSEEHTSELQSHLNLVCRLLLEKKKKKAWTSSVGVRSSLWAWYLVRLVSAIQ